MTQYCQHLTQLRTRSLKLLFAKVVKDSPRAAEPLLLLALCQGRAAYLLKLASETPYEADYRSLASHFNASGKSLEDFLSSKAAPSRYQKIYSSFLSETGKLLRDRSVLKQLVPQLNFFIAKQGISRYRIAEDLGLNKGNLYAFLKGNVDKMSRETAMRVYRYLTTHDAA